MKIDIKTVKHLAESIDKYELSELTLESENVKLVLKKETKFNLQEAGIGSLKESRAVRDVKIVQNDSIKSGIKEDKREGKFIIAPMVGTFYKSAAPGTPAFVEAGANVETGMTLCIIEAMKLMNEVKAEENCKIVKVLVEDGQIVKKGDKLFEIV